MESDYCVICGREAECTHHLIFGRSQRELADKDKIYIRMCHNCHNMAEDSKMRIHGNFMAERLSKMLGQTMWMLNAISTEEQREIVKDAFIERYGRNYL